MTQKRVELREVEAHRTASNVTKRLSEVKTEKENGHLDFSHGFAIVGENLLEIHLVEPYQLFQKNEIE